VSPKVRKDSLILTIVLLLCVGGQAAEKPAGSAPSWYTKKATLQETMAAAAASIPPGPQWGPWHLVGPFPNPDGKGFENAHPPEAGVDLSALYDGMNTQRIGWVKKPEFVDGQAHDLLPHVTPNTNVTVYLYRSVASAVPVEIPALFGSDDTLTVWLNGEKLLAANKPRACRLGDDRAELKLKQGVNHLLLKVCQGTLGFGFAFETRPEDALKRRDSRLRDLLRRDFPREAAVLERDRFLAKAPAVAAAGKAKTFQVEKVRSRLLDREIALVPSFGAAERSFLGSGRVGAGGANGDWDYLIGPAYSSPDFLNSEGLLMEVGNAKPERLAFSMRRIAGSGVLFGSVEKNGVVVELYEFVPWDGVEALRLVHLAPLEPGGVAGARLQARVKVGGRLIQGNVVTVPRGTGAGSYGGECPNWAPRTARIAWSDPAATVEEDGKDGAVMRTAPFDLRGNAGLTRCLVHRVEWDADLKPVESWDRGKAVLEAALAEWRDWFNQGDAGVLAHPRFGLLIESQLAFIRMQQSYDGGLIAGVRRYAYSYPRDMHGAARAFMSTGHRRELLNELQWMDRKHRKFRTIVNSSEMGADVRDFCGGHKGSELPGYYLLMARGYLRMGGDAKDLDAFRESLRHAADVQIEHARKQGWRFGFNGDETERYTDLFYGGLPPGFGQATWSMPSHVLGLTSVDFFARELAPRWSLDPAPYRDAVEALRKSFAETFLRDGGTVPAWTIFQGGIVPDHPMSNYACFPAWLEAPLSDEVKRNSAWEAAWHVSEHGWLSARPGRAEATCGHTLAMLLNALMASGADRATCDHLVNLILGGPLIQHYGLVNEWYSSDRKPNDHNLRPFETGPLTEALVRYIRLTDDRRKDSP
jgi:hypothetical protein